MDLILWRHAQAQALAPSGLDIDRALTERGHKQAQRMAKWLDAHLPQSARVLCSPALRCQQTVAALARNHRLRAELGPNAQADDVLELLRWPQPRGPALLVSHQPLLGQLAARLLGWPQAELELRKGCVWWLQLRQASSAMHAQILAVQSPELL